MDGQNANVGLFSYVLVGVEATFKTYNTCTAGLRFNSFNVGTMKDSKVLEQVETSRTFSTRIGLSKSTEGECEFYMGADSDAAVRILHNAMGGGVVASITATGDTVTSGVFEHTFSVKNFDTTYSSLCINARKGDATNGKYFEYSGGRVNEFSLKAEMDDALLANASLIFCTGTSAGQDLSALLTNTGQTPLNFTGMRLSVADTFASLTASSYWHVQSIEFGISNNLKADSDSRSLGTDTLTVLPPGMALFNFTCSMRFDTLTAYNAMMNETQFAAQMEFNGSTITGSNLKQMIRINLPRVYIKSAPEPEIGGPDEILKTEVEFDVLRDVSSANGYAVQFVVRNKSTGY